jgi:hypothetical protein
MPGGSMKYIGKKDDDWVVCQYLNESLDPYDDQSIVGSDRCAVPYEYLHQLATLADEALRQRAVVEAAKAVKGVAGEKHDVSLWLGAMKKLYAALDALEELDALH